MRVKITLTSVITIRLSVINTLRGRFYTHIVIYTRSVILTRMNVISTLTTVTTHKSDCYTKSVIMTLMGVITTRTTVTYVHELNFNTMPVISTRTN
jgi:hypothetical protein